MRNRTNGTYWALAGLVTLLAWGSTGDAWARFRNLDNTAFNTRGNGPQGAIVVEHQPAGLGTAAAGVQVYATHNPTQLNRAAASLRRLKEHGLANPRAQVRFPRTIVHTQSGSLIQPNLVQTQQAGDGLGNPANNLDFVFEGWSDGDRAALQTYLAGALPKAKLIYGPPAFNMTVKVIQDATIQSIQGGTYDVAANEIRLPPLSGNFPEDTYVLLMLVLNAFHDDAILFYDSWEQGMIGAAAYVIQTQPGVSPGYDPIDPGPFYALSVYECENQPELGNSTFYPASGATNMLVWRIAMARAAWLKCWIEDPRFFAEFNQRYYVNFTSSLPGDIPTLKELAAQALPTVEGVPFTEWYEHQYVLDTSVRTGAKCFTWTIPLTEAVGLITELYETLPEGDERPFGGQGRTIYWNDAFNIQLFAEEGNLLEIPPGGSTPGEGFLLPTFFNIGGPQRVTVQLDVAGLRRQYPFPYGVRGFDPGENNLYGAMLGANDGEVNVAGGNGMADVAVERGVWGGRVTTGPLSPMQATVTFADESGQEVTRQFNIGWDSYFCPMQAGPQATSAHTFEFGLSGLHLMSLPLTPLNGDVAAVLGIAADQLLLAWWDPLFAGENKYRLWPSFPFRSPGNGYWLRVPTDTTVSLQGIQADITRAHELPLAGGWNLIGSPRLTDVPMTDLQVQVGDQPVVTWDEAVVDHLVQDSLFGYTQTGGYELADSVQPWLGYWVRCLEPNGVLLVFPGEAGAAAARISARPPGRGLAWRLPLVVTAGPLTSRTAYLGAAAQAAQGPDVFDLAAPANFGDFVEARFVHTDWGRQSGRFVSDVRPVGQVAQRWVVDVNCSLPHAPVRVSWPGAARLPLGLRAFLLDPTTGKRQNLRTTTGFGFRTGPRGGTQRLVIETAGAELTVTGLSATADAAGVTIRYATSDQAAVSVRLHDMAGRLVRIVADQAPQAGGSHLRFWNLRNTLGRPVPDGVYLVVVGAQADDGREARARAYVRVRR